MTFAIVVLILVFLAVAFRKILPVSVQIWHIFLVGAIIVLAFGQITPTHAWQSIDWNIIIFLWGMLILSQAFEESGLFEWLAIKLFASKHMSATKFLFFIVFGLGLASVFFMNDTIAIIGTPFILHCIKTKKKLFEPFALALAFSITTGSITSPIGNPQNLLIALSGEITAPFLTFFSYLFIPTLLSLIVVYFTILYLYRKRLKKTFFALESKQMKYEKNYMSLSAMSFFILIAMIVCSILFRQIPLYAIAIVPAIILLLFMKNRLKLFFSIHFSTLLLFISLFILIRSVWDAPLVKTFLENSHHYMQSILGILVGSVVISQLISNLPFVAFILPTFSSFSTNPSLYMMVLAAGSTIAGNLLILGAASNAIIVQQAEKRKEVAFHFFHFAKVGGIITILQILIFWGYFSLIKLF